MKHGKSERLIEKIKRTLLQNSLYSEELCNEEKLAAEFGLSRTPIRDALKVLEKEGRIQRRQKKGIMLRVPSMEEISEIYEIRLLLESHAIKKVAETITDDGIAELEALKKHDKAQAVRVVKRHIRKSERTLLSSFLAYPTPQRRITERRGMAPALRSALPPLPVNSSST